jgi:hypothetical protein
MRPNGSDDGGHLARINERGNLPAVIPETIINQPNLENKNAINKNIGTAQLDAAASSRSAEEYG